MPVAFDNAALFGAGSCGCHQQVFGPYVLPGGIQPLILADFKNGVFLVEGDPVTFEGVVEPESNLGSWNPASFVPGTGIVDTGDGNTTLALLAALSTLVTDGCTIVPTVTGVGSGSFTLKLLDLPGWNSSVSGHIYPNGIEVSDDSGETEDDIFVLADPLKAAFNLSPERQAASANGRPVIAMDSTYEIMPFNRSGFWVASVGFVLESIGWYPLQDEADLPTLSAP